MTVLPVHRPPGVNRSLTPKRRRRVVENDEYAAFARRVIRAYSRRVASGDIDAIADMIALADHLDTAIRDAITGLRAIGYSWADIALRLGVTRQAVQQRCTAHDIQKPERTPLWLIERTAVPVTGELSPGDATLAQVITALEAGWRQQASAGRCGLDLAGGHR